MFANDHGWSHKLHEAVATGLTAEAAVERVQSDTRARMLRSTDPYLRDRLHDLEDLGHRLMRQLAGQDHAPSREQLPDNAILIARAMGPAALLDYDRKRLRGLVRELQAHGATSDGHAADADAALAAASGALTTPTIAGAVQRLAERFRGNADDVGTRMTSLGSSLTTAAHAVLTADSSLAGTADRLER